MYSQERNCAASAPISTLKCLCDLYIPRNDPHIFLQQNRQTDHGNTVYKSPTDTWMWKLGMRPLSFFSRKTCFEFSVLCLCTVAVKRIDVAEGLRLPFHHTLSLCAAMLNRIHEISNTLIRVFVNIATNFSCNIPKLAKTTELRIYSLLEVGQGTQDPMILHRLSGIQPWTN
jgi:hypothetical protein